MDIPKRFKLLGRTITVKFDENLFHSEDKHGMCSYRTDEIILQPPKEGAYSEAGVEATFLHELVHHILYYAGGVVKYQMGEDYLYRNEEFVDLLANLLHQYMTTAEYNYDPKESNKKCDLLN